MNQDNGGVIGKINTPTTTLASGVWSLDSQFDSQSSSIWPLAIPQTTIANSCRFDGASSDDLERTPSSSGNNTTNTVSVWLKRSKVDEEDFIIYGEDGSTNRCKITFKDNNQLQVTTIVSSSNNLVYETNRLFRDTSAWYHFVFAFDSTLSTAGDRCRIYVNGIEETSFATETDMGQNTSNTLSTSGKTVYIGSQNSGNFFNGCMAEYIFVDGQQLLPTSFGAFNPVTNIWEPIAYAGTYGTNGFRLDFADSSALGNDVSGNDNDFTVQNLTSVNQSTDTCSNNFATWNFLTNGSYQTLSEGGLKGTGNTSSNNGNTWSTIHFPSAGKWYWETKVIAHSSSANYPQVGIIRDNTIDQADMNTGSGGYVSSSNDCYYPAGSTTVYSKDGNDTVSATSVNDILMCAMDSTAGAMKFWIGVNGTWFASGDPANGNNAQWAETGDYQPVAFQSNFNNSVSETNFGSPTFSISSGNADANGHGNFEYAPPTGFFALCTKNIAEFGG